MINTVELHTLKPSDELITLTSKLNQAAMESVPKEDPAEAVLKAYISMDKTMMKVVDEHIERVRKSSERNKILFRKQAIKKEIEKRAQMRKEYFDEAAEKAETQRRLLQMKG